MSIPFSFDATAWQRLHTGSLGPYIDPFAQHLSKHGYADATARDKLRVVAKLSQWLEQQLFSLNRLDEQQISTFIQELHQRQHRTHRGDASTLRELLRLLRNNGIIPVPITTNTPNALEQLEDDFACYLTEERCLAKATIDNYVPVVHRFLTVQFGDDVSKIELLRVCDVTQFILNHLCNLSPKTAQLGVTALRCFFRFLYQRGKLVTDLAAALPTVADWRLSELPKFIAPQEVEQLLQSCNQNCLSQQRDYAVLLLLARLGLRAGEVVHLNLDDINWRTGLLNVRGKGGRIDQLPLPMDVGEALVRYLRNGRPNSTTSRRLFVRLRAPYIGFASSAAIDCIMHRALQRAELDPPHKGAHLLRHSLATRMLHNGASLAEIGQMLRHRLTQTTEIYAKVDQTTLGALAQPWPGERP